MRIILKNKELYFFILTQSFFLANFAIIWSLWFCKYVFHFKTNWSTTILLFFIMFVGLCFILFFLPRSLVMIHEFWGYVKNFLLISYVYRLIKFHPKIFSFIIFGLIFIYTRLELSNLNSEYPLILFFIFIISLVRTSLISSVLIFQLLILNEKLKFYWENSSLIKNHYFHSTSIRYGPANIPPGASAPLENYVAIVATTAIAVISGDVGNRVFEVPKGTSEILDRTVENATKLREEAIQTEVTYSTAYQNLLNQSVGEKQSPVTIAMQKSKMDELLERAQLVAATRKDAERIIQEVALLKDEIAERSGFLQAVRSYFPDSPLEKARKLSAEATNVRVNLNHAEGSLENGVNSILELSLMKYFF